jgi:hypothetical protein
MKAVRAACAPATKTPDGGAQRRGNRSGLPQARVPPFPDGCDRPQRRAGGQITEGERLCEELLDLIDRADATSEEIRQRMAQLAAYRRKAAEEVKQAQEALRQVVTRRQEAMLILMGHLD